mgnify:CR=1 FL=1
MKKMIFTLALFTSVITYSQNGTTSIAYTPDSVKHIERMCLYPGGQDALMKDIANNFIMPKKAKKDKLQGKIFLKLTVDTLGFATGKILKGLRADVDSAAIDMTKKLKQFVPSAIDERKVPTTLTIPIAL